MAGREVFAIMDLEWTFWEGAHQQQWSGPGTAHQGLGDCRCIAETLRILRN
jgi:hypothetical protein